MGLNNNLIHSLTACDLGLNLKTLLLPKNRNTASDLDMRGHMTFERDYLLAFAKIGHVSLIIRTFEVKTIQNVPLAL